MKYNVGDKVRIKSFIWYNENKKMRLRSCIECGKMLFTPKMSKFCGEIITITGIIEGCYIDETAHFWTDEMIECKVEEETFTKFEKIPSGAFAERIYRQQYDDSLI